MDNVSIQSCHWLTMMNIPYKTSCFPITTDKGAANVANIMGFQEKQMVKTLIFELDSQETILVMVGGDSKVISGNLKRAVGARNIKMASPETVMNTCGYKIGSIPPFSWQPEHYRSFLDTSLLEESELGVGSGVWGYEIIIQPQNLLMASNAQVCNLTKPF